MPSLSLYLWSQTIFAISGIFAFLIVAILTIAMFLKYQKIHAKIENVADKTLEVAESAKNMAQTGEKVIVLSAYKTLKNWLNKEKE